jgi:hypothetical protein
MIETILEKIATQLERIAVAVETPEMVEVGPEKPKKVEAKPDQVKNGLDKEEVEKAKPKRKSVTIGKVTLEQVHTALKDVAKKFGPDEGRELAIGLLNDAGATAMSKLKKEKFGAVFQAAKDLLDG